MGNQYAYELIIQSSSPDVKSIGYTFGESTDGYFTPVPNNYAWIVGVTEGSIGSVTVQAVMNDGAVLYKTFYL